MTPIPIACPCGRAPSLYPMDPPVLCVCGRRWDYVILSSSAGEFRAVEVPFVVQPMLALDLDETIRFSRSGAAGGPQNEDDVALFPGVEAKIWEYKDRGFRVVGITNQGVVGAGTRNEVEVIGIFAATMAAFARNPFDAVEMAYGLPVSLGGKVAPHNLRSLRRKPGYGMLVAAERAAFDKGILIDWDASLMVGDRADDERCAHDAGVAFQWAWDFFGRPHPGARS